MRTSQRKRARAPELSEAELENPTVAELAKLAAILASGPQQTQAPAETLVARASEIWRAANVLTEAEKQTDEIVAGVLDRDESDWGELLKGYWGDKKRLAQSVAAHRFSIGRLLLALFPGKKETEKTRKRKFSELVAFARKGVAEEPEVYGKQVCAEAGVAWPDSELHGIDSVAAAFKKKLALFNIDETHSCDAWTCRWLTVAKQRKWDGKAANSGSKRVKKQRRQR